MKISTKGRYALRMMLDLAEHQQDGFVALKDIAARQNISKKYLEQIVPILNKSNFLQANRGFQGGYRLVNTPREYTVGSILRHNDRLVQSILQVAEILKLFFGKFQLLLQIFILSDDFFKFFFDIIQKVIDLFFIVPFYFDREFLVLDI